MTDSPQPPVAPHLHSKGPSGRKLLRSTGTVGAWTLLSRILGLVRDVVYARLFGASFVMDAFFVAFRIPNIFRRFFAEGAFSQAFVPVFAEYDQTREHAEVRELVRRTAGTLGVILSAIAALGALAAPVFIGIFAPGFAAESWARPPAVPRPTGTPWPWTCCAGRFPTCCSCPWPRSPAAS